MPDMRARSIYTAAAVLLAALLLPGAIPAAGDENAPAAQKPKITVESPDSTVVATVNGEPITKGELMEAMWGRYAIPTLTDLIDKVAIRQAAQKAGVTIEPADLDAKVNELKDRLPPGMTFEQFLEQYNITEEQLRKELETSVYIEKAAAKNINVTDQDLAGYIKARHILISTQQPGATAEEREKKEQEAKAKLEQIAADIKAGKTTFEQAAKEFSDDPGSKDQGGDLGFFKRGVMTQPFEEAAFNLKAGEMSEPVKTTYGYHLILVEKLGKDAEGQERADLIERIRQERLRPEMTAWYLKAKQEAQVERALGEQPKPPTPPPAMGESQPETGGQDTPPPPPPAPESN